MRILHLSTYDIRGGAARAAYRLHRGLRGIGHDSRMLVARRYGADPSVEEYREPTGMVWRIVRRLRRRRILLGYEGSPQTHRPAGYELFSQDRSVRGVNLGKRLPECDVINLHWVSGFVDYVSFFRMLPPGKPLVWTLHDMNVLTGGCHYDSGCRRFEEGCGRCPQLGSDRVEDLSRRVWRRKHRALHPTPPLRLRFVADSRWLAEEARRSPIVNSYPIDTIHYALDLETFLPRDRRFARDVLDLPVDSRIVLFVADSVVNRRKGFAILVDALQGMERPEGLILLSLGGGEPRFRGRIEHRHLGPIEDDRLLSLVYSAADVFVIPSLQEAFGQTALEAMACGTPVVGFRTGGIPEIVRPGETGELVPVGDAAELRGVVRKMLDSPEELRMMRSRCRRAAEEGYGLSRQAEEYLRLYEDLISEGESTR